MGWRAIILLISLALSYGQIDFSLSCQSAKIDTVFDYEVVIGYQDDTFSTQVEVEREDAKLYLNYEIYAERELAFLYLSVKKLHIGPRNVDLTQVSASIGSEDVRYGATHLWLPAPEIQWYMLRKSKYYSLEVNTKDFKFFMYSASLKYTTNQQVNYFIVASIRDYNSPDWSLRTGIAINL